MTPNQLRKWDTVNSTAFCIFLRQQSWAQNKSSTAPGSGLVRSSTAEKGWLGWAGWQRLKIQKLFCPRSIGVGVCSYPWGNGKALATFNCAGLRKPVTTSELVQELWAVLNVLPGTQDIYENTQQSFHQNKGQVMSKLQQYQSVVPLCDLQGVSATAAHPLTTTGPGCCQPLPSQPNN